MTKKDLQTIKKISSQLFDLLGVAKPKLAVIEKEDFIYLDVESEDSSLLIGYHGESLASLQLIISLLVYKKLGEWQRIVLDVNGWRGEREEYLEKLALNLAQKVKFSGQPVQLPALPASERRIVHLYLKDHPDVVTYSEGEGRQRRLIIKTK